RAATDQQEDFRADLQLALMGAAETFDPGAGRWYTYANHWVARATPRYDGAGLPVPRRRRAVLAARDDLHGRLHRPATREEIAAAAGVSEQHAVRTQMLVTAGQLDPDHAPATESAEEAYLNAAEAAALQDSISRLHRDSRHAIKARLDGLSISGIAEQTQTSPATVRRRIDDAIDQLRRELAPTARTLDDRLDELRTVTLKRAAQRQDMGRPQPPIQPVIPLESGRSGPAI
ncbi:MAG TPA: sigma-70 family RNA polymerase sigma factor, partial [Propionibacteriaceae bacterium]|nr:sigma-70 family RNA polymerase sigma factor [Propionibacteriaceae bacterium]